MYNEHPSTHTITHPSKIGYTEHNSVWTKSYKAWPLVFSPESSTTMLCVGYVVVDDHMNQIYVVHARNSLFANPIFSIDTEIYDLDWAFSVFSERLKLKPDIDYHRVGDDQVGSGNIGEGLYIGQPHSDDNCYIPTFTDTIIRHGESFTIDLFKRSSLLSISSTDIVSFSVPM